MKLLIISLLLFSFTGCSSLFYKAIAERKQDCMERFVKLDIDGVEAAKMCEIAYKKK
jgi:hypothetical protein